MTIDVFFSRCLLQSVSTLFLCFALYSFLGWICEVVYCLVFDRRLTNRGFLSGPYCPLYGFGALFSIALVRAPGWEPVPVFMAFVKCAAINTAIEYFTALLLEKGLGLRLWDYSARRLNLGGRICLANSLVFGAMGVGVLCGVQPVLLALIRGMPSDRLTGAAGICAAIMATDTMSCLARSLHAKRPG